MQDEAERYLEKANSASNISETDAEKTLKLHQEAQAFADRLRQKPDLQDTPAGAL